MKNQVETMESEKKKGSKLFKLVGIVAVVGVLFAVWRLAARFLGGKPAAGESTEGA
jgi:hypothetical protein